MIDSKKSLAVFVRMASRPVPRVQRGMHVAEGLGLTPIFCGALREEGLERKGEWAGYPVVRIGRKFPLLNGKRFFLYFWSVALFQFSLIAFLFRHRPALIHASDVETMPGSILYAFIHRIPLIYNVHDNLAQRYNLPRWIQSVLNTIEGICVVCSSVAMVPEAFRREALPAWCRHKIKVVRNTPRDVAYSEPKILSFDEKIKLFYGGWLDWGRGLEKMIQLAESIPNAELVVAGEGSEEIIQYLTSKKCVNFIGFIGHDQAIKETQNCHFVLAFYRPSTIINRYAASNKLAEALAVGRPLVLNSEMKIIETFGASNAVISETYEKIGLLGAEISALYHDKERYELACKSARSLYEQYYQWENVKAELQAVFSQHLKDGGR